MQLNQINNIVKLRRRRSRREKNKIVALNALITKLSTLKKILFLKSDLIKDIEYKECTEIFPEYTYFIVSSHNLR